MKSRKSPARDMRQTGKEPGKHIKTSVRKRTATVVTHKSGKRGGSTRYRFPMPDKAHARAALADLPKAKGLTSEQKGKIRARAQRMLGIK